MWKCIVIAVTFGSACAAGLQDSPGSARQAEALRQPTARPPDADPAPTTEGERQHHENEIDVAKRRAAEAKLFPDHDASEAARMKSEKDAVARAAVAMCQADVDGGSLARAASCWNARLYELRDLDASLHDPRGVPGCLDDVGIALRDLERCAGSPERTDDDVLAKKTCLAAYRQSDNACGPLDLVRLRAAFEAKVDFTTIQARVESKAAPIVARREKVAADEAARLAKAQADADQEKKRCIGTSVLQIVLALRVGRDVSVPALKGCTYDIVVGTVQTTTRDGWMIVGWGDGMVAAFKSRKRHADGSLLRTSAKASYIGLGSFDRTDGGSSTVATFRLAE
jgi:hypothetical protein